jgi:nucleotide-binding universal stress UspA family protein
MPQKPTVLCPIDYSEHARVALRYAALVADHFGARLLLLTVSDPLLVQAALTAYDAAWLQSQGQHDLRDFYQATDLTSTLDANDVRYESRMGKPAPEILKAAAEAGADLIVMSTHGLSGARKAFFGATTERVLRETTVPVLVTSAAGAEFTTLPEVARAVGRILVPVDLTDASGHQLAVANGLAVALGIPIIVTHVIEPLALPMRWRTHGARCDDERRTRAEDELRGLTHHVTVPVDTIVAYGDPAEEIAKLARDRGAGLVVIGLHGSTLLGPRMGSVTYRVLCLSPTLVLAIPPSRTASHPHALSGTFLSTLLAHTSRMPAATTAVLAQPKT